MIRQEKTKRFMLQAFSKTNTKGDQQFIPLLHPGTEPQALLADNAQTQKEDARRAFEEAYVEGEKAGFEMGMKKVEPLVKRLNLYISELESHEQTLAQKAEELAFKLALTFAESIVLKECADHQDTVLRMVRKALELCEQKGEKIIRIRPEDSKFIENRANGWIIIPDDTLKEPGFLIETDFGDVDARVSTQIEELKREFMGRTNNDDEPNTAGRA